LRNYLIITAFLALASLSWWLNRQQDEIQKKGGEAHKTDFFTENMTSIEMNGLGLPSRRLNVRKTTHYADDGSTDLENPNLVYYEQGRPPLMVRSSNGWVSDDTKDIWLRGQVYFDREADVGIKPYHMVTSEMHITGEPDYAETSQPVFVISNGEKVDAIGMQAWLKPTLRVKLLSQVKGRYEKK